MLTKPRSGWSTLVIGDFTSPVSYLLDTPQDCINAFTSSLEFGIPFSIYFDGEGRDCLLVGTDWECYTIVNESDNENLDNNIKVRRFEIGVLQLASEFVEDIERDYEAWQWWDAVDAPKEYDLSKLKELLNKEDG